VSVHVGLYCTFMLKWIQLPSRDGNDTELHIRSPSLIGLRYSVC